MVKLNLPYVFNFTNYGEGYHILKEAELGYIKTSMGIKMRAKCYPVDIEQTDPSEIGFIDRLLGRHPDLKILKKPIEILLQPNCRFSFPRGFPSGRREMVYYISPFPNEMNPEFRESPLYKLYLINTNKVQLQASTLDILNQDIVGVKNNLLRKFGSGELTNALYERFSEWLKLIEQTRKEEKPKYKV